MLLLPMFLMGCEMHEPQLSSSERDTVLRKVTSFPCDASLCGALWVYDDAAHGVRCYISAGKHDLISCVKL